MSDIPEYKQILQEIKALQPDLPNAKPERLAEAQIQFPFASERELTRLVSEIESLACRFKHLVGTRARQRLNPPDGYLYRRFWDVENSIADFILECLADELSYFVELVQLDDFGEMPLQGFAHVPRSDADDMVSAPSPESQA